MKAEQEEIIRQEHEYEAAEEIQSLRELTDLARAKEEERLRKEEIERHLAGKFDHLSGEERVRAEVAERLAGEPDASRPSRGSASWKRRAATRSPGWR